MTHMTTLAALIVATRTEVATRGVSSPAMSRGDVFQALYDSRYTGRIVMDFKEGQIAAVSIPSDIRIRVE